MNNQKAVLIDAAKLLYCQKGVQATTIWDLLAATHTSEGEFYKHFEDKKALTLAVIGSEIDRWEAECFGPMLTAEPDDQRAILRMLDWFGDNKAIEQVYYGCFIGNLVIELSLVDEDYRSPLEAMFAKWTSLVAQRLEGDLVRAQQMIAGVQGTMLMLKVTQDPKLLRANIENMKKEIQK